MTEPQGTSRSRIYTALRRALIMGHLKPGERLNVEELARRYETSITPVRDALQMLAQEGLVTIRPRAGYFVTRISLRELRDLLDLREVLETAAAERAATRITNAQIEQLTHVHAGYTGDDDESYDRYTDENRRFHYLVALASGNQALAEMVGRLHDRLARFMVLRHAGQVMEQDHIRIIEALRAHDPVAARQAIQEEVRQTSRIVLDLVIQEEGETWHVGQSQ